MPALRMKDATITSLTNIPGVSKILTRLGFRVLEHEVCLLRPVPFLRSAWGRPEVLFDLEEIMPILPEWERAIAVDHGELAVVNSLFVGNKASSLGGAIFADKEIAITNTTFTANDAPTGGAMLVYVGGDVTLDNSILWGDTATSSYHTGRRRVRARRVRNEPKCVRSLRDRHL